MKLKSKFNKFDTCLIPGTLLIFVEHTLFSLISNGHVVWTIHFSIAKEPYSMVLICLCSSSNGEKSV